MFFEQVTGFFAENHFVDSHKNNCVASSLGIIASARIHRSSLCQFIRVFLCFLFSFFCLLQIYFSRSSSSLLVTPTPSKTSGRRRTRNRGLGPSAAITRAAASRRFWPEESRRPDAKTPLLPTPSVRSAGRDASLRRQRHDFRRRSQVPNFDDRGPEEFRRPTPNVSSAIRR